MWGVGIWFAWLPPKEPASPQARNPASCRFACRILSPVTLTSHWEIFRNPVADQLRFGARGPPWLGPTLPLDCHRARGDPGPIFRNVYISNSSYKCCHFSRAFPQMYMDSFKILSIPFYSLPFLRILPAIFPGFSSQNSPWDVVVSPGSCFISLHPFSAFGVIF